MDKRLLELQNKLSKKLVKRSTKFMIENFNESEKLNDALDFIVNSYMNALFNHLIFMTENDEKLLSGTKRFIEDVVGFINKKGMH